MAQDPSDDAALKGNKEDKNEKKEEKEKAKENEVPDTIEGECSAGHLGYEGSNDDILRKVTFC